MPQDVDLDQMMRHIDAAYVFSAEVYPQLKKDGVNPFLFGVGHSNLHMQKAQHTIASELEKADHGRGVSIKLLRDATAKQLVNVLKLAAHLDMSAADLARHVEEKY